MLSTLAFLSVLASSVLAMPGPALGHHADPYLVGLSHLPVVVGVVDDQGTITTQTAGSNVLHSRALLENRYYGDDRGFTQPSVKKEKRALPTGWNALGCVNEGTTGRTLSSYSYMAAGAMTVESCLTTCLSMGYSLAGLQWFDECYCGDSFSGGGGGSSASDLCYTPCAGNKAQICGGSFHLNAYAYTAPSGSPTCTLPPSTSSAASKPAVSASASASASASSKPSSSSSSAAVAKPSASTTPGSTSTEWENLGCFNDNPALYGGNKILTGTSALGQSNMTPAICQASCDKLGYNFAGLEYGQECYCGDLTATQLSALQSNSGNCNMACTGDASSTCGGGWALQLFEAVDVSDC